MNLYTFIFNGLVDLVKTELKNWKTCGKHVTFSMNLFVCFSINAVKNTVRLFFPSFVSFFFFFFFLHVLKYYSADLKKVFVNVLFT